MSIHGDNIRALMCILRNAGYSPQYKIANDPSVEDDEIVITQDVYLQVDSNTGELVAVCRVPPLEVFWPVDGKGMLRTIVKAIQYGE